jgi:hypothetical protein
MHMKHELKSNFERFGKERLHALAVKCYMIMFWFNVKQTDRSVVDALCKTANL